MYKSIYLLIKVFIYFGYRWRRSWICNKSLAAPKHINTKMTRLAEASQRGLPLVQKPQRPLRLLASASAPTLRLASAGRLVLLLVLVALVESDSAFTCHTSSGSLNYQAGESLLH